MKKRIMYSILVLFIVFFTSCDNEKESIITAYYNDTPIYEHEVDAFVEMKSALMEIYYNNLEEVEEVIPEGEDITERELLDFIMQCQYKYSINLYERYFMLDQKGLETDYYISLMRYEYFLEEFDGTEPIVELREYNRMEVENIDNMYCGKEVDAAIKNVAKKFNLTYDECIEQVYLNVAVDLWLHDYIPAMFRDKYYEGEVYEHLSTEKFMQLNGMNEVDVDLQEYWDITEKYYSYVVDLSIQFYDYLENKIYEDIIFK